MTAYREALVAHLKAIIAEVSVGVLPEIVEAARRAADNPAASVDPRGVQSKAGGPVAPSLQALTPKASAAARGSSWDMQQPGYSGSSNAAPVGVAGVASQGSEAGMCYVAGLPESISEVQFRQLL